MAGKSPQSSSIERVASRAWCRVDLAGGTLDIWPLGLLHDAARTVNVAIDLAVEVEMRRCREKFRVRQGESMVEAESAAGLAEHPEAALLGLILSELGVPAVELTVASASPRGGGLGASSALAIATIAAAETLLGLGVSEPARRSALARDIEARLMGLPTGRQDHFPALLGGVLDIRHLPGGEEVRPLSVDLEALGQSMLVIYTGQSHFSAGNNWKVVRRRLEADPRTVECFDGISRTANSMVAALEAADFSRVGELMSQEWHYRSRLAEGISTPRIEELLSRATEWGAWGGKACGAGGGGCVALVCPPQLKESLARQMADVGGQLLPTTPVAAGVEVEILG